MESACTQIYKVCFSKLLLFSLQCLQLVEDYGLWCTLCVGRGEGRQRSSFKRLTLSLLQAQSMCRVGDTFHLFRVTYVTWCDDALPTETWYTSVHAKTQLGGPYGVNNCVMPQNLP